MLINDCVFRKIFVNLHKEFTLSYVKLYILIYVYPIRNSSTSDTVSVSYSVKDYGVDCRPSFSPGSFPRQVDGKTLIPDAMLDSHKACHRYRVAVAPICGSAFKSLTGGK